MVGQSREEKLEKKRLAERRRRARIVADQNLHRAVKAKDRARYASKKAEGKIIPTCQLSSQQKHRQRERIRLNVKLFRQRAKERQQRVLEEDMVVCETSPDKANDPLATPATPSERSVSPPVPPIRDKSPQG